ncbi:MAG: PadR family transcriptional regulator [Candidatus Saccharibacteria bacterium]|nr:PadR family transcriptional regulator [Candidatus Saccharibacteria bacterium]
MMDTKQYADGLARQLRKGFLAYCVLQVCAGGPRYSSDIIQQLRSAELVVVEGTIYPLLTRLQKDGLLEHQWQESEQGPPRKYYSLTNDGRVVIDHMTEHIATLNTTLKKLTKGVTA